MRRGYGAALLAHLESRPNAGLLSGSPERLTRETAELNAHARAAWLERDRFEPILRRHPNAEHAWLHWSFWPGTVITRAAAEKLVPFFEDPELARIIDGSPLQATEETLIPTFTALLGLRVEQNPFSNRFSDTAWNTTSTRSTWRA